MDLDELRVSQMGAVLVDGGHGGAVADGGSRAAPEDLARAAGGQDDHISREGNNLVGIHILGNDAAHNAILVLDDLDELPELVLLHAALNFPAAHLLI